MPWDIPYGNAPQNQDPENPEEPAVEETAEIPEKLTSPAEDEPEGLLYHGDILDGAEETSDDDMDGTFDDEPEETDGESEEACDEAEEAEVSEDTDASEEASEENDEESDEAEDVS